MDFGSIIRSGPSVWSIFASYGGWMCEPLKGSFDIAGDGEVTCPVFVVPSESKTAISGAGGVNFAFILLA